MRHFPEFIEPLLPCNLPVRRCPTTAEAASRRIIIQRHGGMGDILMASPLLTGLRDAYPDAHITWAAEGTERGAIEANPYVDRVLLWDSFYWFGLRRRSPSEYALQTQRLRELLHEQRYDLFITFQPEEWTPLVTQNCGATVTIGVFDGFRHLYGSTERSPLADIYTHAYSFDEQPTHRTEQNLLPLTALGLPHPVTKRLLMGYTEEDADTIDGALQALEIAGERFVVVAPRAKWPSRCWPEERFVALSNTLGAKGFPIVLVGSASDTECAERMADAMAYPAFLCVGALAYRELAALLDRAALVISGDTGPMHLAAAVETPFVALFGPTPVEALTPLHGRGLALSKPLPCAPCYKQNCPLDGDDFMQCLRQLSVEEATSAAFSLLADDGTGS